MSYGRELDAALRWLDRTDPIALAHFEARAPAETKADGTPVTEADRAVEQALRAGIAETFSEDGVLGEEYGAEARGARRWIVDPIDGTKNFARGVPAFATLVALEDEGRLVVGAVSAPALGARWWAIAGGGAFRDGHPIRVSDVDDLSRADVCTGSLREAGDRMAALAASARRTRGFGDFWGHVLVAEGALEAMVEFADLALWDVAACRIVVEEAGGRTASLDGAPSPSRGPMVSANAALLETVLELVG